MWLSFTVFWYGALYTIHMGSEVILEECGFPLQFAGKALCIQFIWVAR